MITPIIFYLFSSVLIISALGVTFAKNPVHAVLCLIMAFFNAGALFLMLGAEFVAMSLLIVYVGAVAVLFLFVVMMLDISSAFQRRPSYKGYWLSAMIVGLLLMAEMVFVFSQWDGAEIALANLSYPKQILDSVSNTHSIGLFLYTDYVWMFEVSGFILLVAMISAIVLTQRNRGGIRRQNVIEQVSRKREDVVKITTPKSGEGVV